MRIRSGHVLRLLVMISIGACARDVPRSPALAVHGAPSTSIASPRPPAPTVDASASASSAEIAPAPPPEEIGVPTGDALRVAMRGACRVTGVSFPEGATFVHVQPGASAQPRALRWTRDGRLDATSSTWGDDVLGEWPSRAFVLFRDGQGPQRTYVGRVTPGRVELVEGFGTCTEDSTVANGLDCGGALGYAQLFRWSNGAFLVSAQRFVRALGGTTPTMKLTSGQPTTSGGGQMLATSGGEIVYAEELLRVTTTATTQRLQSLGTFIEAWSEAEGARTITIPDRVRLHEGPDGRVLVVRDHATRAEVVSGKTLRADMPLPMQGAHLKTLVFMTNGDAWASDGFTLQFRAMGSATWIDTKTPIPPSGSMWFGVVAEVAGELWMLHGSEVVVHRGGARTTLALPPDVLGLHATGLYAHGAEAWITFTNGAGSSVLVTNAQVKEPRSCDEAALDEAIGVRHWSLAPSR